MTGKINIGGEFHSVATEHKVADVTEIKDAAQENKSQAEINNETNIALADRYTKEEAYSKQELNSMITTPNQQYVTVTATDQTTSETDVLPAEGSADTVYRVGNWDGTQYDITVYSEYAWDGTQYVHLSTKTQIGEVFDISAYRATGGALATYVNLSAALAGDNVPASIRRGGMSVKFVHSSDNKYVQFRLMNKQWSTTVSDWQGVDEEPVASSKNLVESGGVFTQTVVKIGKQQVSGFVQGDGVYPRYLVGGTDKIGIYINDYYFTFKINSGTASNWRSRIFYADSEIADYSDVVDGKTYGNGTRKILGVSIYLLATLTTLESLDVDVISGLTFVDEQQGKQITDLNEKSVKITSQSFTDAQKGIARGNIDAASQTDLQTLEELFPQHDEWEKQSKTTGTYALVPNQISGYVGNRVKSGTMYGASSSKALTSLIFQIDKTKRYKLKAKIGPYNDGLALYSNSDGTGYIGHSGWTVGSGQPDIIKEEELSIPDNANYIRIATLDSGVFEFSIYNDDYIPIASQEEVDNLGDRVDQNDADILNLYGIVSGGDVPPENAVKYVPTKTLYLGTNVLDISNVTYNSTYWTTENGLPKYLGGGNSGTTFKFNAATIEGARYLAEIQTLTQDSKYEGLFYLRIGDGPLVDTYNGGRNTFGGFVSDGGQFEIIPYGAKAFDITGLTLKQCLQSDQAIGYAETKVITVDNVDAGNSAATLIDGKWNVAIGPTGRTMSHNVGGSRSIGIGLDALKNWFAGIQNIGIGTFALSLLEEGNRNIAIGCDALWQTKKANDNVGIGQRALSNTGVYDEISNNVAIGTLACGNNQAATQDTVAIGYGANRYGIPRSVFVGSNTTTTEANKNIVNVIAIGYNLRPTKSNQVIIGNADSNEFILGNKKLTFNQDGTVSWGTVS